MLGNTSGQKLDIILNEAKIANLIEDVGKKLSLKVKERKSGDKLKE
jgi:hypothetical protein